MDPHRRDDPALDKARAILGFVTATIGVFPLLTGITWLLTTPDQGIRSVLLVLNGLVMVLGGFLPTRRSRFLGSNRAGLVFLLAAAIWLVLSDQFIAGPLSPAPTPASVPLVIPIE